MAWGDIFFWPFESLALGILGFVIVFLLLAFIIWMILDCAKRKFRIEAERWIWIVLIIVTKGIGAIIYYIVIRALNPQGIAKK